MKLIQKIDKILQNIKDHPIRILISIFSFILINYFLGHIAAIFLGTFILFILLEWDSRFFIVFGLIFLLACPLFLLQRKELMAEEMAVYAYFCLFLGVCLQLIEYLIENHVKKSKK